MSLATPSTSSTPDGLTAPAGLVRQRIRPRGRWAAVDFAELWRFRDLLLTLAQRDLKLRYKQTALGVSWVLIQPLLAAGALTLVFGFIAGLPSTEGIPYFALVFMGQIAWALFANVLNRSSAAMVGNAHLVSKVYFPRLILPASTVMSVLVDFAVALLLAVPIVLIYGKPGPGLLLLPVCILLLVMLALGSGLVLSAMMVSYRDVQHILPVMIQLLTYLTPVAYGLSVARDKLSGLPDFALQLYMLNPLASLIETFRWSLLGAGEFHPGYLAWAACVSVVMFVAGVFAFRAMERKFADVI